MRIVFPYPTYWPYVRRGAERCIHDLSNYLVRRGHEVDIITSKPGAPRVTHDGGARVVFLKDLSHPLGYRYAPLLRLYAFGLKALAVVARERYDAAYLWSYSSVGAAPLLKRVRGLPYLFHLIVQYHHWPGRLDRWLFHQLIAQADTVAALTPAGADAVSREHGVNAVSLSPPVDTDVFRPLASRDLARPLVLFPGDLGDPRKGGALLLRAWDSIHRRCPEAVLVLAGPFGLIGFDFEFGVYTLDRMGLVRDPDARRAIEIRGPGSLEELPLWYSQAAVTVLPSVQEAFGMVVTESLACGTPVVCSSGGGPGEIVTSPEIGATVPLHDYFDLVSDRRAEELADAVLNGIELSRNPATAGRCREWVRPWSLEKVGAQAESILAEMARTRPAVGELRQRSTV